MTALKQTASRPPKKEVIKTNFYDAYLLGNYQALYIGQSTQTKIRERAASGGIATALLLELLQSGRVEGIICADVKTGKKLVPQFVLLETKEALLKVSGSKYVFMDWKGLNDLLEKNQAKKLAIIVQPCFIPALRKLQSTTYQNIQFIISFFCGYNMGFDATVYMLNKSGIRQENVQKIEYRGGPYPGGFTVYAKERDPVFYGKEIYEALNLMFLRRGCGQCSLYMGEEADIALGDAWLKDEKQWNVVISRTTCGQKLLRQVLENKQISLYHLDRQDLFAMHWHNIKYKKYGHTFLMRLVVTVLNRWLPKSWVPFFFLARLSKIRRRFKIGIILKQWLAVLPEHMQGHNE